MRVLVRANAHRPVVVGAHQVGVEVASSPDTPSRPDRWAWSIRVLERTSPDTPTAEQPADEPPAAEPPRDGKPHVVSHYLEKQDGSGTIEVAVDPELVSAQIEVRRFSEAGELERDPNDLIALLVTQGAAQLEGRHLLRRLDTLVLEGDDPLRVSIDPAGGPASVAVVRLRSAQTTTVNWVP